MTITRKSSGGGRVSRGPKYVLKVKVQGPGVHRKSIAVPELLRICDAIQSAIHRQAEAMEKPTSPTLRPGPITASAHEECTLELVGLVGGSTGLLFRLEKPQQPLPLPDANTFGTEVVATVAEIVGDFASKKGTRVVDPGVLDSLKKLGEVFARKGIDRITLSVPKQNGRRKTIRAVFTKNVHHHILERVKIPTEQELTIEGKLEMADFKELGKICRIHPPVGVSLQCTFEPEKEDEVYAALRKPVRLSGMAKINPNTGKPEELRIQSIEILDELLLGVKEFFASRTLEQLAQAQGVKPLTDPNILVGGWSDEDDINQFMQEIYQNRS